MGPPSHTKEYAPPLSSQICKSEGGNQRPLCASCGRDEHLDTVHIPLTLCTPSDTRSALRSASALPSSLLLLPTPSLFVVQRACISPAPSIYGPLSPFVLRTYGPGLLVDPHRLLYVARRASDLVGAGALLHRQGGHRGIRPVRLGEPMAWVLAPLPPTRFPLFTRRVICLALFCPGTCFSMQESFVSTPKHTCVSRSFHRSVVPASSAL